MIIQKYFFKIPLKSIVEASLLVRKTNMMLLPKKKSFLILFLTSINMNKTILLIDTQAKHCDAPPPWGGLSL